MWQYKGKIGDFGGNAICYEKYWTDYKFGHPSWDIKFFIFRRKPDADLLITKLDNSMLTKKYKRVCDGAKAGIYSINNGGMYPVHAWVEQSNGSRDIISLRHDLTAFSDTRVPYIIEDVPFSEFKKDDKVLVWNKNSDNKLRRYFAGVSTVGKPMVFSGGRTSWNCDLLESYDNCEKCND